MKSYDNNYDNTIETIDNLITLKNIFTLSHTYSYVSMKKREQFSKLFQTQFIKLNSYG